MARIMDSLSVNERGYEPRVELILATASLPENARV